MGIGLAALLVTRKPADQPHEQVTRIVVPPPQTLPAPIAVTLPPALRDGVRLAFLTNDELIASDKLAIWSEIRRPVRMEKNRRTAVAVSARAPARQTSPPSPNTTRPAPDFDTGIEPATKVVAMRVQLARG
jgi:hypothetical protein